MQIYVPFIQNKVSPFNALDVKLTSPLILLRNPLISNEAATKEYVDNKLININANRITSGILAKERFSNFTGDVTSFINTGNIQLIQRVQEGYYTKVGVNSKGLITSVANLDHSDLPNISWNKVTGSVPTNLSGYGITNGISIAGDVLTGYLGSASVPNTGLDIVNKKYVDSAFGGGGGGPSDYVIGTILHSNDSSTPSGFLRCNGSELEQTTYSDLYSVIGYKYSFKTYPGAGKPWINQYEFNTGYNRYLSAGQRLELNFDMNLSIDANTYLYKAAVLKNKAYLIGGKDNILNTYSNKVYSANILASGVVSNFDYHSDIPAGMVCNEVLVFKDKIYILGGYSSSGINTNIYYANIDETTGTLSAWSTLSTTLPSSIKDFSAGVIQDKLYIIGGRNNSSVLSNLVYYCTINANGTLSNWSLASSNLIVSAAFAKLVIIDSRIFAIGGLNSRNPLTENEFLLIQKANVNSNGLLGNWSIYGVSENNENCWVPQLVNHEVLVFRNTIIVIGGFKNDGSINPYNYSAIINSSGDIVNWQNVGTQNSVLDTKADFTTFITKTRVYAISGNNGDYATPLVANTVHYYKIEGGLNDYSDFYKSSVTITDTSSKFRLPDLENYEYGVFCYIKY